LASLLVILTAFSVSTWMFQKLNSELVVSRTSELDAETLLQGVRFRSRIEQVQRDVAFLAEAPTMQGIIRAQAAGGVDPLDGSTNEELMTRLAGLFEALVRAKPTYLQVRFVGIADDGRELVRVDRLGDGGTIRIVGKDDLARKGHATYFAEALRQRRGVVILSEIELNRENGVISEPQVPVIRAVTPVFTVDGKILGAIVINQDVESLFEVLATVQDRGHTYFFTNSKGDYLYHPDRARTFRFEYGEKSRLQDDFPEFEKVYSDEEEVLQTAIVSKADETYMVCLRKSSYDENDPAQFLGIMVMDSFDQVLGISRTVKRRAYLIVAGMVIVGVLAAFLLARRISDPIVSISRTLQNFEDGKEVDEVTLPVKTGGEAGQLARAFQSMLKRVKEQRVALEKEVVDRQNAENEAKAVVESASDAILTIDNHGTVLTFNPRAVTLFGYEVEEIVGQSAKILIASEHHKLFHSYLAGYRKTGTAQVLENAREFRGRRKDGLTFELELTVGAVENAERNKLIGIIRDIGERKRAERELTHSNQELARSNADLEQFAYVASHDLQAPLRTIISYNQLLAASLGDKLDEECKTYMSYIVEAGTRMRRLLNDLLLYSQTKKDEVAFRSVSLQETFKAVVDDLGAAIEERHAKLSCDDLPTVMGDPTQLRQLLQNLMSNGIKYSTADEPTVHVSAQLQGQHWRIAVKDNGPGIDSSHFQRIFEIFQRLHSNEAYEGTGIGLSICKKIVERHNGEIWVESEPGEGSTFYFTLEAVQESIEG
jgi:PAS domain S-box-containing protein